MNERMNSAIYGIDQSATFEILSLDNNIRLNAPRLVHLSSLGTSATDWPIVPAPGDYDDVEFDGKKIGKGNRSTQRKTTPAPLCPPQIPLHQTWAWTQTAAVGCQRLTAWAMARPLNMAKNYGIQKM
jgi:hypothetical protein